MQEYVLITGASKGIGYSFAKWFLNKGYNIIAVARNTDSISSLVSEYDNEIITFNYDLSIIDNCYKLFDDVKKYDIKYLVNNAGYGILGPSNEVDLDKELNIIDLNIKALHILTKLFLNKFSVENNKKRRILNIASIVSFLIGPNFSTYYASKSYVYSLTSALNMEYKKTNVSLVSICPGPIKTNFWYRANSTNKLKKNVKGMSSDKFASKCLSKALKTRKNKVLVGFSNKMLLFATKILSDTYISKKTMKYNSKMHKLK